ERKSVSRPDHDPRNAAASTLRQSRTQFPGQGSHWLLELLRSYQRLRRDPPRRSREAPVGENRFRLLLRNLHAQSALSAWRGGAGGVDARAGSWRAFEPVDSTGYG